MMGGAVGGGQPTMPANGATIAAVGAATGGRCGAFDAPSTAVRGCHPAGGVAGLSPDLTGLFGLLLP
jgi:hypothetical protein